MEVAVLDRLTRSAGVIVVSLFFVIMLVSASVAGYRTLSSLSSIGRGSDPGWWIGEDLVEARIVSVRRDGPAANSLVQGDRILAINGDEFYSAQQLARAFERLPPGSRYSIFIER